MKLGIMTGGDANSPKTLEAIVAFAQRVEAAGFHGLHMANIRNHDAIMAMAFAGQATSRLELGTAVVPTYPRHPTTMAQQALSAAAASGGRFHLGIGLSHKVVIEDAMGMSYDKPAKHMREYLQVLSPLLSGKPAKHTGELYKAVWGLEVPDAPTPVPLLVAALGPVMLKLAATYADGTVTWMTGPRTIGQHVRPSLDQAAGEAGRPSPRIVAGVPVVVTENADEARAQITEQLAVYGQLPSYRAMLDREGVSGPADVAIVGNEKEIEQGIGRYADAGVTELNAHFVETDPGASERTFDLLKSLI